MPISAIILVPAAPLLLPGASPRQPAAYADATSALRAEAATALAGLPSARAALLLVAGDESLVTDTAWASLASYGLPDIRAKVQVDTELIGAVSARGQAPRVRSDRLDGDAAVLALLLAEHRPGLTLAPVTVPASAGGPGLAIVAAGIAAAVAAVDGDVVIVAAGDLSATLRASSPGYIVDGATEWDDHAVAAVRATDPREMTRLGPTEAERVQARGWAPMTVALFLAQAAGLRFEHVSYAAPKDVGQIVAR